MTARNGNWIILLIKVNQWEFSLKTHARVIRGSLRTASARSHTFFSRLLAQWLSLTSPSTASPQPTGSHWICPRSHTQWVTHSSPSLQPCSRLLQGPALPTPGPFCTASKPFVQSKLSLPSPRSNLVIFSDLIIHTFFLTTRSRLDCTSHAPD